MGKSDTDTHIEDMLLIEAIPTLATYSCHGTLFMQLNLLAD